MTWDTNDGPSHSLKSLIPVIFAFDAGQSSTSTSQAQLKAICPSCKKELSNSTHLSRTLTSLVFSAYETIRPLLIVLRSCSHIICKACSDTLVRPSQQCSVCDKTAKDKDIINMEREGHLFAEMISTISSDDPLHLQVQGFPQEDVPRPRKSVSPFKVKPLQTV